MSKYSFDNLPPKAFNFNVTIEINGQRFDDNLYKAVLIEEMFDGDLMYLILWKKDDDPKDVFSSTTYAPELVVGNLNDGSWKILEGGNADE